MRTDNFLEGEEWESSVCTVTIRWMLAARFLTRVQSLLTSLSPSRIHTQFIFTLTLLPPSPPPPPSLSLSLSLPKKATGRGLSVLENRTCNDASGASLDFFVTSSYSPLLQSLSSFPAIAFNEVYVQLVSNETPPQQKSTSNTVYRVFKCCVTDVHRMEIGDSSQFA